MYAPATTPVELAQSLAPVGVVSTAPVKIAAPLATHLEVRHEDLNVLESHQASVSGELLEGSHRAHAGRVVTLQSLGAHGWRTVASARTGSRGRFHMSVVPRRLGSQTLRLRFRGDALARSSRRRLGKLNVFRLAGASWYGGGGGLACGGELTSSTLGVANKTLPCGTIVTLRYGAHSVRVPVIDRGPFVAGREFDLTEATKAALGFGDTGYVWSTN